MNWIAQLRNLRPKERIYILPSGRGFLFLLVVMVIVVVGATYNNNLIFLFAFFLFSLFVVAMVETHVNLRGVELKFVSAEEAFAGEPLALLLQVSQERKRYKRQVEVRTTRKTWGDGESVRVRLSAHDVGQPVRLLVHPEERGVYPLPALSVETYYPLGLFRAWKISRPSGEMIVYPRPEGLRQIAPAHAASGEHEAGLQVSPEGDFGELRQHREGDSYHQVAWKHFARSGILYNKIHWGEEHRHYHIPWDPRGLEIEKYLCQMSLWVKTAVDSGASFEMDLPNLAIECGDGLEQARVCWRALARFGEGS